MKFFFETDVGLVLRRTKGAGGQPDANSFLPSEQDVRQTGSDAVFSEETYCAGQEEGCCSGRADTRPEGRSAGGCLTCHTTVTNGKWPRCLSSIALCRCFCVPPIALHAVAQSNVLVFCTPQEAFDLFDTDGEK